MPLLYENEIQGIKDSSYAAGRAAAFAECVAALRLRESEYRNDDADRWLELAVMNEAADIIEARANEKP